MNLATKTKSSVKPLALKLNRPYEEEERNELVRKLMAEHPDEVKAIIEEMAKAGSHEEEIEIADRLFQIPPLDPYFYEAPAMEYPQIEHALNTLARATKEANTVSAGRRGAKRLVLTYAARIIYNTVISEDNADKFTQEDRAVAHDLLLKAQYMAEFDFDSVKERAMLSDGIAVLRSRLESVHAYNSYDRWWTVLNGPPKPVDPLPIRSRRHARKKAKERG